MAVIPYWLVLAVDARVVGVVVGVGCGCGDGGCSGGWLESTYRLALVVDVGMAGVVERTYWLVMVVDAGVAGVVVGSWRYHTSWCWLLMWPVGMAGVVVGGGDNIPVGVICLQLGRRGQVREEV